MCPRNKRPGWSLLENHGSRGSCQAVWPQKIFRMNWMVLKLGPGDTQLSLQPRPTSPLQRQKLWVWKTRWEKGKGGQLRDGWEAILHFFTFSLYFSCSTVGGGQWGLPFGVCALRAGGSLPPPIARTESCPAWDPLCLAWTPSSCSCSAWQTQMDLERG